MNSNRAALLCMAGPPRRSSENGARAPRTAIGAVPDEQGDMLNVRVTRSGGWWLPFFLGIGAGVAGSLALYRWKHSPPSASP